MLLCFGCFSRGYMNRSPPSDSNLSFLGAIQPSKPSRGPRVSSEHVLGLPTTPARPREGPWSLVDHKTGAQLELVQQKSSAIHDSQAKHQFNLQRAILSSSFHRLSCLQNVQHNQLKRLTAFIHQAKLVFVWEDCSNQMRLARRSRSGRFNLHPNDPLH